MVMNAWSGQWISSSSILPLAISVPSFLITSSSPGVHNHVGDVSFTARRTRCPSELKKKATFPAPGPAVGIVNQWISDGSILTEPTEIS
jgi:hypothetical protein